MNHSSKIKENCEDQIKDQTLSPDNVAGIIKETGDVSLSPELGDMDFDLEGDDSPDQAVWKVIKFVAALKRNTEKKKVRKKDYLT